MEKKHQILIINISIMIFFVIIIFLLYQLQSIFLPFILALIISYILNPLINHMQQKGIPLVLALLIIFLYIFLLLYAFIIFVLPDFFAEIQLFIAALPQLLDILQEKYFDYNSIIQRIDLPDSLNSTFNNIENSIQNKISDYLQAKIDSFISIINCIFAFILAPVLTFYMLRDKKQFKKIMVSFLPPQRRDNIIKTANRIDHLLKQFLYGYLSVSLIVGLLSTIFLMILGIKYAVVFGLIMAVGELIPYFGPALATIFVIIITFLSDPLQAIYATIALIIVQQIDSAVITPKIIGQRTGLHPLAVIFVVLAGGYWFGIIGMLLAVPVSAILWLIFVSFYDFFVSWKEN